MKRSTVINIFCVSLLLLLYMTETSHYNVDIGALVSTLELSKLDSWSTGMLISFYPPLATFFFWLLIHNPLPLSLPSSWLSLLFLSYLVTILWSIIFLHGRGTALLAPILLVTAILVHPRLLLARFDVLVSLLLLLTIFSFDQKQFRRGGFFLGCAIAMKFVPIFLLPLVCVIFRRRLRPIAEGIALSAILNFGILSLIASPSTYVKNWSAFLQYRSHVSIDALSNLSAVHMLGKKLAGEQVQTGTIIGDNLTIWNLDLPHSLSVIAMIVILVGIGWMALRLWKNDRDDQPLFPAFSAVLLWFLLLTPHFSPHYLVWVLPLVLFWLAETGLRTSVPKDSTAIGLGILAVGFLTQWVYPLHWTELYTAQSLPLVIIHVLRACAMAWTVFFLWTSATAVSRPSRG